jgi:hypothetical protein
MRFASRTAMFVGVQWRHAPVAIVVSWLIPMAVIGRENPLVGEPSWSLLQ